MVVGSAIVEALRTSLDADNHATAKTVEAVTALVREIAEGVTSARKAMA